MAYSGFSYDVARLREWMGEAFDRSDLRTLRDHGAACGVPGLIYTADVMAIYREHSAGVLDACHDLADELGGVAAFLEGFALRHDRLPEPGDYVYAACEYLAGDVLASLPGDDAGAIGDGWAIVDDVTLETCCGEAVEYDAPECPECGAVNPLVIAGAI